MATTTITANHKFQCKTITGTVGSYPKTITVGTEQWLASIVGGPFSDTTDCEAVCGNPCPDGDPSMKVTVSWSDAAACKEFFGETWTNGETKLICPTNYTLKGQPTTIVGTGTPAPKQNWRHNNTLIVDRSVSSDFVCGGPPTGPGNWQWNGYAIHFLVVSITTREADYAYDYLVCGSLQGSTTVSSNDLGMVTTGPFPTTNNYKLLPKFFGSHTQGTTTFTWAKGPGDWDTPTG